MIGRDRENFFHELHGIALDEFFDRGGVRVFADEHVIFRQDFELVRAETGIHAMPDFSDFGEIDKDALCGSVVAGDFAQPPRAMHAVCAGFHRLQLFANGRDFGILQNQSVNFFGGHKTGKD